MKNDINTYNNNYVQLSDDGGYNGSDDNCDTSEEI